MAVTTPLEGALAAVRRGWFVFPLRPGEKEPYGGFSWPERASNSETQILSWAKIYPGANWGLHAGKSGLAVLDIDVKHGATGPDSLAALEAEYGNLPATLTIKTPSGGEHRYFAGASRSRRGFRPGLDMKSGIGGESAGYVLLPGSEVDGEKYEIVLNHAPTVVPEWLPAIVGTKGEKAADHAETVYEGQHADVVEAVAWLANEAPKAEVGSRDDTTFKVAARLRSRYGLDAETAVRLMSDVWLPLCPDAGDWSESDIEWKVSSAYGGNARLAQGAEHPRSYFDNIDDDEEDAPTEPTVALKPVEYVIDGFISAGALYLGGGHGVGKSSFLAPLTALVSGELPPSIESGLVATLHRVVVYFAEDQDQIRRCRHALAAHHGLVENKDRFILRPAERRQPEEVGRLIRRLVERHTITGPQGYPVKPLVVFDTSNACFEIGNENDSQEIGRVMSAIKTHSGGAPVWIIGHISKALLRADFEALTGRGSGAWEGDAQQTCFVFCDESAPENVRFLGVKKTRFEPAFREARLETTTDCESVETPWGETQSLVLRHGIPARSSKAERLRAREERKLEIQQARVSEAEGFVIATLRDHAVLTKTRLEELVKERDVPRRAARDAIAGLIDRGAIEQNAEVMAGATKRTDGLRLAEGWTW